MKRISIALLVLLSVAALTAPPPVAAAASAEPIATLGSAGASLIWQPHVPYAGLTLTVSGPDGMIRREFAASEAPSLSLFDGAGNPLADGTYSWELRIAAQIDAATRQALVDARKRGDDNADVALRAAGVLPTVTAQSGYFTIADGALVAPGTEEARPAATGAAHAATAGAVASGSAQTPITAADQIINDDLIVTGSICVGFDCVNGENFSFDTIRAKENSTRVQFFDTSVGSFPTENWQIRANGSSSGNFLAFVDQGADGFGETGTQSFVVESGARANALVVESDGDIGVGTVNPVLDLHIVTGNTPGIRLDQDGSSGFSPQVWDIAGNESNFFIRDVTGGSRLPFRIRPGAPTSSIDINASGNVGIGTASPDEAIHMSRSGDVAFKLADTSGSGVSWLFKNNTANHAFTATANASGGNAPFKVFPTTPENTLVIGTAGGAARVGVNVLGPTFPLEIGTDATNGNGAHVTAAGVFTNGSSRRHKVDIRDLAADDALAALAGLQPVRYYGQDSPDQEEYVGFIAEDVPALVAQNDRRSLSPMDIVAVLTKVVQLQQKQLAEVEAELQALKSAPAPTP